MKLNNVIKYDGNYTPKEPGFYLLCLLDNAYGVGYGNTTRPISMSGDCYIDGIREKDVNRDKLHQSDMVDNDKPFVSIFDNYGAVPVIGKYQDNVMKDYLTGKVVRYADVTKDEDIYQSLCYYAAFKLPNKLVFNVLDLLNSEDIRKYRKAIDLTSEMLIINANDKRMVRKRQNKVHK